MDQKHIESLYELLDNLSSLLEKKLNIPYLDTIALIGEAAFTQAPVEELNDILNQQVLKKFKEINLSTYSKEEIRKALQLTILKGMKEATQQQHLITPDSVAIFMGYLVQKFTSQTNNLRLFDPACGTGNLLTAIINQLNKDVEAYGSDVDPTLIKLAYVNANLQHTNVELFHQDSLQPFLLEPVDFVVSDLPVGYYPDDIQAQTFQLQAKDGHSFAHHLFIEQSLNYVKPGGYMMFVIPNFLFESDQAEQLNEFIREHAHIIGLLQLPKTMFKSDKHGKSIFILQKKDKDIKPPKQALLAQLPSFKDVKAMDNILTQINNWFSQHLPSK